MTKWQITTIMLALPSPLHAPCWKIHCFELMSTVVVEVKLTSLLPSSPPPLIWLACIPNPLTPMPYNSCTLKANHLILALEQYLQKSLMWMNGTIHSSQKRAREFTVQKRGWLTRERCIGYAKSARIQRGNEWTGAVWWMGDSPHLHPSARCLQIS